jgi:hypothetical protein
MALVKLVTESRQFYLTKTDAACVCRQPAVVWHVAADRRREASREPCFRLDQSRHEKKGCEVEEWFQVLQYWRDGCLYSCLLTWLISGKMEHCSPLSHF